eukprot:m.12589 g.12589  ORF g.12589 m.12589 type:complete len:695 (+) comp24141_c0_seq2:58-2142(+)
MLSKKRRRTNYLPPLVRDSASPLNKRELAPTQVPVLPFLALQQDNLGGKHRQIAAALDLPPVPTPFASPSSNLHRRSEPPTATAAGAFDWALEMALNEAKGRHRAMSEPSPLHLRSRDIRPRTRVESERLPPVQLQHLRGLDDQHRTGRMYHARPGGNPVAYLAELREKFMIGQRAEDSPVASEVAIVPPIVINEVETRPPSKILFVRPPTPDSGLQSDFDLSAIEGQEVVSSDDLEKKIETTSVTQLPPKDEGINEDITMSSVSTIVGPPEESPPPTIQSVEPEPEPEPEIVKVEEEPQVGIEEEVVDKKEQVEVIQEHKAPSPELPPPPTPPVKEVCLSKQETPDIQILKPTTPISADSDPPIVTETKVTEVEVARERNGTPEPHEHEDETNEVTLDQATTGANKKKTKTKAKESSQADSKKVDRRKKRQPVQRNREPRKKEEKLDGNETEDVEMEEENEVIEDVLEQSEPEEEEEVVEDVESRPNSAEERERIRKEKEAERERRRMAKKTKRERMKREREEKAAEEKAEVVNKEEQITSGVPEETPEETSTHTCPHLDEDPYDYEKEQEDEAERLRAEEEERQRALEAAKKAREAELLAREEEERRLVELRRQQLAEKRRLEEEQRRAEEEMRARIRRQLEEERARQLNRMVAMGQLQLEMLNVEERQRLTRAFVWSYFQVTAPATEEYEK